jgi:hypothetical protein
MTLLATLPSEPPQRFPVVHYNRTFTVQGIPVFAAVTNLTAAFLEQLFDDEDDAVIA